MEPRSESPAPSLTPSTQRSRFPQRLRFRGAVENAHLSSSTAASTLTNTFPIADPTHVLAQEILQACHVARFSHVSHHLSSSSRRPYSATSVQTSATASTTSTIPLPSLRQLHQVLLNASSTSAATHARLPHESQVISVCLSRFLAAVPDNQGEEEKLLALACWDILIRSWMTEVRMTASLSYSLQLVLTYFMYSLLSRGLSLCSKQPSHEPLNALAFFSSSHQFSPILSPLNRRTLVRVPMNPPDSSLPPTFLL
jgi:hypothetical protein